MVAKVKSTFECAECGASSPQWAGRCATCGEWNTLVDVARMTGAKGSVRGRLGGGSVPDPIALSLVPDDSHRLSATGISELDRVLGGGLVPGSVTLLGGEPGIGKSTLVLQLCASLAAAGARALIVTGEESVEQVGRRARRLGAAVDGVELLAHTEVEAIVDLVQTKRPTLLVVDSVQTMHVATTEAAPGTPSQVRECAQAFVALAKSTGVAVLLVGHVTKEGALAGPRLLEHIVDTVLEFEGERHHGLRFLRAVKHRFGATDEVGVLQMTEGGLETVADASGLFLDDRHSGISGSVVVPLLDGRRPMLVELQALVVDAAVPQQPRRVVQGLDSNRFAVSLAVLRKRGGVTLAEKDIYASIAGGVRATEPAVDLPLALAVASAVSDTPVPEDVVAVGEVGLGGELRKVSHVSKRLGEAARLGFRRAIVPVGTPEFAASALTLLPAGTIAEALAIVARLKEGYAPRAPSRKASSRRDPSMRAVEAVDLDDDAFAIVERRVEDGRIHS